MADLDAGGCRKDEPTLYTLSVLLCAVGSNSGLERRLEQEIRGLGLALRRVKEAAALPELPFPPNNRYGTRAGL